MNIENLITTIERMEADLTALKLKARKIKPALDALATVATNFGPTITYGVVEDVEDIQVGMQFISSVSVDTFNNATIPAGVAITVTKKDGTNVPLYVTWQGRYGGESNDWVQVRETKLDLSKLTRIK